MKQDAADNELRFTPEDVQYLVLGPGSVWLLFAIARFTMQLFARGAQ